MKIGYLAQKFPHLTMTFVYRELLALQEAGLEIETFSTWKPGPQEISAEAKPLRERTFYIFPLHWPRFFLAHLRYLVTRPRPYLGTLAFLQTRRFKSLKNRLRTFLHFCEAVYLAREVERQGIDHLHVHFALNAATMAMVVSRLSDVTFSFTAHANDIFCNHILLREKIQAARFVIVISAYNRRYLHDILPTREADEKTHVVHCGVDVERFSPPLHRSQNDRATILAVGRLVEKKGLVYLVKACKRLADQGHDFCCQIVGSGPQQDQLAQLIRENDLASYVSLEGAIPQEELKAYLNRTDIFALPCVVASDQDMDGIPNSLMEAMAMEIPCISTTVSGIPELIENRVTGMLVPPRDEVALAQALATLLENEELRSRLGKNGRAHVVQEFEITKNAQRLLKIFETYLGNKLGLVDQEKNVEDHPRGISTLPIGRILNDK